MRSIGVILSLALLAWPVTAMAAGKGRDLHIFNETGATIAITRNGDMHTERLLPPKTERYLSKYLVIGDNELQFAAICHGDRMGKPKTIHLSDDKGAARSLVLQSSAFGSGALFDTPGCGVDPQNQKHMDCLKDTEWAMQQIAANRVKNCGHQGPLWNEDFRAQYEWCLEADAIARDNAYFKRTQGLAGCEGQAKYDGDCRAYAQQAAKQSREAGNLGCQPTDGMWSTNPTMHEEFCKTSPGIRVEEQIILRAAELKECRESLGAEAVPAPPVEPESEQGPDLEHLPGFEWFF